VPPGTRVIGAGGGGAAAGLAVAAAFAVVAALAVVGGIAVATAAGDVASVELAEQPAAMDATTARVWKTTCERGSWTGRRIGARVARRRGQGNWMPSSTKPPRVPDATSC
jgi:hypothetical protein